MGKDANLTLFFVPSTNIGEEIETINMYVNMYRRVGPWMNGSQRKGVGRHQEE